MLEAFDAALDGARTQWAVLLMKFVILHSPAMPVEVIGLSGQASALQRLRNFVDLAQKQVIPSFRLPAPSGVGIGWKEGFGGAGQVFSRMVPVHNLHAIGE